MRAVDLLDGLCDKMQDYTLEKVLYLDSFIFVFLLIDIFINIFIEGGGQYLYLSVLVL